MRLKNYLTNWQKEYQNQALKIPLFEENFINTLSYNQKQKFVLILYHFRGHFYEFLWYVGSLAPSKEYKNVILENTQDEFGRSAKSHELLFIDFAENFGVDIKKEILEKKYYFEFLQDYNHKHLSFILNENWTAVWAAFSSFEKLDNIDYLNLYNLILPLKVSPKAETFFKVHIKVNHAEVAFSLLEKLWNDKNLEIKKGFDFIANHQLKMWQNLYEELEK